MSSLTKLDLRGALVIPKEVTDRCKAILDTYDYERHCEDKDWFNPGEVEAEREEHFDWLNKNYPQFVPKVNSMILAYLLS